MFEYMTAQEAAEKWNVSLRWVQRLCKGNRIEGVMNITEGRFRPPPPPSASRRYKNRCGARPAGPPGQSGQSPARQR